MRIKCFNREKWQYGDQFQPLTPQTKAEITMHLWTLTESLWTQLWQLQNQPGMIQQACEVGLGCLCLIIYVTPAFKLTSCFLSGLLCRGERSWSFCAADPTSLLTLSWYKCWSLLRQIIKNESNSLKQKQCWFAFLLIASVFESKCSLSSRKVLKYLYRSSHL